MITHERMEIHNGFPFSDFLDFESQDGRYSVCFIIRGYNNCVLFSAFISHLMDAPNNNIHVFIFTDFPLQNKMDFQMKEGALNHFTPPLLERFTSVVTMGSTY